MDEATHEYDSKICRRQRRGQWKDVTCMSPTIQLEDRRQWYKSASFSQPVSLSVCQSINRNKSTAISVYSNAKHMHLKAVVIQYKHGLWSCEHVYTVLQLHRIRQPSFHFTSKAPFTPSASSSLTLVWLDESTRVDARRARQLICIHRMSDVSLSYT